MMHGAIRHSHDCFRIIAVRKIPLRTITHGIIEFAEESHVRGQLVLEAVFKQPAGAFVRVSNRLFYIVVPKFQGTGDLKPIELIADTHTQRFSLKFSGGLLILEGAVIEVSAKIKVIEGRKIHAGGMHQTCGSVAMGISLFEVDTRAVRITRAETGSHIALPCAQT